MYFCFEYQAIPRGSMLWTDQNAWADDFAISDISQPGVSSFSGNWGDDKLAGNDEAQIWNQFFSLSKTRSHLCAYQRSRLILSGRATKPRLVILVMTTGSGVFSSKHTPFSTSVRNCRELCRDTILDSANERITSLEPADLIHRSHFAKH
jgi:hypothetical protein